MSAKHPQARLAESMLVTTKVSSEISKWIFVPHGVEEACLWADVLRPALEFGQVGVATSTASRVLLPCEKHATISTVRSLYSINNIENIILAQPRSASSCHTNSAYVISAGISASGFFAMCALSARHAEAKHQPANLEWPRRRVWVHSDRIRTTDGGLLCILLSVDM